MKKMGSTVRVRFAPSPTGPLHIGALRTALYNYLFARKNQGAFLLRIEDTDQKRYVENSESYIFRSLEWAGLIPDESPQNPGAFGPYRQSERTELYQTHIQQLLDSGHAYYAFDTPEELEAYRKEAESAGNTFSYGPGNRRELNNSLFLEEAETQRRIKSGEPYVIRFLTPENQEVHCPDLIRGDVVYRSQLLDDKVLFKSDGLPTYHLANVVDDHLMQITHVIRGEEWLPSLPLHVLLYKAFGWQPPALAHLPLILKPSGPGKLSKRDALKGDFPIYPLAWEDTPGFRERGYLPEAMNNILALLGWSPADEQEVLNLEELVRGFALERVHKAGARFDPEKNLWFNQQHLQKLPPSAITELVSVPGQTWSLPEDWTKDRAYLERVVGMVQERLQLLPDLEREARMFFEAPREYDPKATKKAWKEHTAAMLEDYLRRMTDQSDPTALKELAKTVAAENELGMGAIMAPLRLSLVGSLSGPDLFAIVEAIGPEETRKRVERAIETL